MAKKKEAIKKNQKKDLSAIKRKNFFKNNIALFAFLGFFLISAGIVFTVQSLLGDSRGNTVFGDDVVDMYYFHSVTCPFCIQQNRFNEELERTYPQLRINKIEASSSEFRTRYLEFAERFSELDPNRVSTPITIIGDRVQIGFASAESTGLVLIDMIEEEIQRIEQEWDDQTMVRTINLLE